MEQKSTSRYGLPIDAGPRRSADNRSKPPRGCSGDAKSPPSNKSDKTGILNSIGVIDQFQKSFSPRSLASPETKKSSRQKHDDSNLKTGSDGNRRKMHASSQDVEIIETKYVPKFFNYEPAALSPRSAAKREKTAIAESTVEDSSEVTANASPRIQVNSNAVPRISSPKQTKRLSTQTSPSTKKQTSPNKSSTKPKSSTYVDELSLSDSNNGTILPSTSSASFKTTFQLQKLMRTPEELILRTKKRNNKQIPLNVVCNEDGFEVQGFSVAEKGRVYRIKCSVKYGLEGALPSDVGAIAKVESLEDQSCVDSSRLGKNGWHRLIDALNPEDKEKNQSSFSPEATSTLDQISAIHTLQHSFTAYDEYDALCEERSSLMQELGSLEKDRLCLERMFHEIEKEIEEAHPHNNSKSSKNKHVLCWDYKDFKENITRINHKDKQYLPLLWLEELAIVENLFDDVVGTTRRNGKKLKQKAHLADKISKRMADGLRDERGNGLALLISDVNAKNSVIGRCYMNSIGKGKNNTILSAEGPAILIPQGGSLVRYFGVTGGHTDSTPDSCGATISTEAGANNDSGTSYFIKFDGKKSYYRGMLPANLTDRMVREDRDSRSMRYLSTGQSSTESNMYCVAPYYVEFDDGECWWGSSSSLSQENDKLHSILLNTDVHRVAFGIDAWVVIGKDGDVVWKNLPQGLHDLLSSLDISSAAPCAVSLGMGGSYFVRFLDGSIQYSLPSFVAEVCERLEAKGHVVRNVSLCVDTYDCLVRYSSKNTD